MTVLTRPETNFELIGQCSTREESHRLRWAAIAADADARLHDARHELDEVIAGYLQAKRRPPNLAWLLELAVGVCEAQIASAELDLRRARRQLEGKR